MKFDNNISFQDDRFIQEALFLAKLAYQKGEVPVGAVIVDSNRNIIAQAHNLREINHCATAHAELLAIQNACQALGRWRLTDCTLYVTLEPCFMCAGAIVLARIPRVVFATCDPKAGAVQSLGTLLNDPRLNHQCIVHSGVREKEARDLLKTFFKARRK